MITTTSLSGVDRDGFMSSFDRKQYAEFLDRSGTEDGRLAALGRAAGPPTSSENERLVTLVPDSSEPTKVRIAGLKALAGAAGASAERVEMLLEILGNRAEPVELRHEVLTHMKMLSFSSRVVREQQPEYRGVLRVLVDDPDEKLRERALEILALQKDEYAQRRLVAGLHDPTLALVRPERAIHFLGYDIHTEYYPLLRQIAVHPPNSASKHEAVRLLAGDPSAKPLLTAVLRERREDPKIRGTSAVSLQSIAPLEFELHAKQIVVDDSEHEGVRLTCLQILGRFGRAVDSQEEEIFEQGLDRMCIQRDTSEKLRQAVFRYRTRGLEKLRGS